MLHVLYSPCDIPKETQQVFIAMAVCHVWYIHTGEMKGLLTLKLEMNRMLDIPDTIGGLESLTELFLFENMIDVS